MSKTTIKTKLSRRQYFFMIVQTEIGVGILSLPYDLHSAAKQDGWISLLIGGVLLQIVLLVIWLLAKRFPDKDFFQ
ncbi:MAG: GerAB/ArcD/ProY family transporter, partial [Halobacillus sp.]